MSISIITCSQDDAKCRALSENYARLLAGESYEMIRIADAKSLCEGYNRGFRQSKGEIIILCHDDIEILGSDFKQRLLGHMQNFDLIGVAGTMRVLGGMWAMAAHPYLYGQIAHPGATPGTFCVLILSTPTRAVGNIQALDGAFMAARRDLVAKVGFDEQNFDGFHCYDADFSFRAHLAGFRVGVACDIPIYHASSGTLDQVWWKYMEIFARKHQGRLHPMGQRPRTCTEVTVNTRQEILEVMRPPHWAD